MLQMGMTLFATLYWIRFVLCCVNGYEWIVISGRNTYRRKYCVCIDWWRRQDKIPIGYTLHPSKQQITNLIQCRVATGVTPTYHTTNTPINYHLINLHVMFHAMKLLKLPCFSAVLLHTQLPLVLYPNNLNVNSIPITILFLYTSLPCFIIKICYEIQIG